MNKMQVQNKRPNGIEITGIVIASIITLTALSNKGYFAALSFSLFILVVLSKYSAALKGTLWFMRERNKRIVGMAILLASGFLSFPKIKSVESKTEPQTEIAAVETTTAIVIEDEDVKNEKPLEVIPNLTAADVYMNFTKKGFELTKSFDADGGCWYCSKQNPTGSYSIRICGKSANSITGISATFADYTRSNTNEKAAEFLEYIGTIPYGNAEPETARKWIKENIGKRAKTKIGGVTYMTFSKHLVRTLVISVSTEDGIND